MLFLIFTRKNHFDIYVIFFQNSKKAEKVDFSRLTDFLKNIKKYYQSRGNNGIHTTSRYNNNLYSDKKSSKNF